MTHHTIIPAATFQINDRSPAAWNLSFSSGCALAVKLQILTQFVYKQQDRDSGGATGHFRQACETLTRTVNSLGAGPKLISLSNLRSFGFSEFTIFSLSASGLSKNVSMPAGIYRFNTV